MKKLFTLLAIIAFSTTGAFAASSVKTNLKNAVKQDIQNAKKANEEAQQNANAAKKAQKIKEIDARLAELEKEKKSIQTNKNITETQRTLELAPVQRKIDFYKKQKEALK